MNKKLNTLAMIGSWIETLKVTINCQELLETLHEVDRDVRTGAYKKYSNIEDVIKRLSKEHISNT